MWSFHVLLCLGGLSSGSLLLPSNNMYSRFIGDSEFPIGVSAHGCPCKCDPAMDWAACPGCTTASCPVRVGIAHLWAGVGMDLDVA